MDLFDFNNNEETAKPLAERMRANHLDEFIGQKHIVAEGSLLRRAIAADKLGSCIFWGPPGCGKTTLANIIAMRTNGEFIKLNAVNAGVSDVKKAVEAADKLSEREKLDKKEYVRRILASAGVHLCDAVDAVIEGCVLELDLRSSDSLAEKE